MGRGGVKGEAAFRTIGELSEELGVPQHVLRYWESRFPQLRPLQRAGNRRYYRPGDVALARRIDRLLNQEGYTIKGVQRLLAARGGSDGAPDEAAVPVEPARPVLPAGDAGIRARLLEIRALLADALAD